MLKKAAEKRERKKTRSTSANRIRYLASDPQKWVMAYHEARFGKHPRLVCHALQIRNQLAHAKQEEISDEVWLCELRDRAKEILCAIRKNPSLRADYLKARNAQSEEDSLRAEIVRRGHYLINMGQTETLRDLWDHLSGTRLFAEELVSAASLAESLRQPSRTFDTWLAAQLSRKSKTKLNDPNKPSLARWTLEELLLQDLNGIIRGPSIFESYRFKGIALRLETKSWIPRKHRPRDFRRLNRLLIEDAYPLGVAKKPRLYDCDSPRQLRRLCQELHYPLKTDKQGNRHDLMRSKDRRQP